MTLILNHDQLSDLAFIKDPNQWPKWPYLPLVGSSNRGTSAILFDNSPEGFLIAKDSNLWADYRYWNQFGAITPEEVVRGWRVD